MSEETIIEQLSQERKQLQQEGYIPEWFTTHAWQLFKQKYLWDATGVTDTYKRIQKTAAQHAKTKPPKFLGQKSWEELFFRELCAGRIACSTPVLSNMGTEKGCPVSCSGGYIPDSVDGWYSYRHETALLTKYGFGTSGYLGDIRPRGTPISTGGTASGSVPVFQMLVDDMRKIAQGTSRRGAWAGYIEASHGDFWELVEYLESKPDDLNVGWIIDDDFIQRLEDGDKDAHKRWSRIMKVKATTGKGYLFKRDTVNRHNPQMYKDNGITVDASNLCTEITLFSDEENTFTCVLSSLNAQRYDEWEDNDTIFIGTVFLDCVAEEFISIAENIPALWKAVNFTRRSRALGLGVLGFHTYLQQNMIPFEDFQAHMINNNIFKDLHDKSLDASQWMAKEWGEPELCKGYGVRNTHRTAIAPNTSSALLCGGVSQGIEPVVANVFQQGSAAGNLNRINPVFLELMQERGHYNDEEIHEIAMNNGSVQNLDWLTDHEKEVFKTAYEIDQRAILRMASARQPRVCQAQSLNTFFSIDEEEEYISEIHREAMLDPNIKSLYYLRSQQGVQASKGECQQCEG